MILTDLLRAEIATTGPISCAQFMQRALYEPALGYYARTQSPTGRRGDFITSVSVGACFGNLLAEQIADYWQGLGQPPRLHVVEQGANDGQLMADLLAWLARQHPGCFQAVQPHFIEPLATARAAQQARVPNAIFHQEMPSPFHEPGVFLANELLDAFPVERVRWTGQHWQPLAIDVDASGNFIEVPQPTQITLDIPTEELPAGYTTELSPELEPWMQAVSRLFPQGLWMLCDYGLTAENYYAPHRTDGTLRGYSHHQMQTQQIFQNPGTCDLTTHVNWTSVAHAATAAGLRQVGYGAQLRFLTALAAPLLTAWEGPPTAERQRWLRQFQTLTNPAEMGSKFQVLLLVQGASQPLLGCKFLSPTP